MNKEDQVKIQELRKKILEERDFEKDEILQKSKEIKGRQLIISPDGGLSEANELTKLLEIGKGKNSDEAYELFYHGIYNVLNKKLPSKKGDGAFFRTLVYDEIGVLLSGGKLKKNGRRGADPENGLC